jgi:hypothetical protein
LWVIFALLDPDPYSNYGSGSNGPIEYGSGSETLFLLASIKSLTYCEIPFSNPFQKACSGFLIASRALFRNPPVILKIVLKAGYECPLE